MAVMQTAKSKLPTRFGEFEVRIFRDEAGLEHMAVTAGRPKDGCLVRVHSECATGDILGSLRCDCGDQLAESLRMIAEAGEGAVIYLRGHEGRGIGLGPKIAAYALQDRGLDTVEANRYLGFPADPRNYDVAVEILRALGLGRVRLITNNPVKIAALAQGGLEILERVPLWTRGNSHNRRYIETKKMAMGHLPAERHAPPAKRRAKERS